LRDDKTVHKKTPPLLAGDPAYTFAA